MNRLDLSALSVFALTAELGSFRAAARRLAVSPSAVSHAVAGLEARLGARLLARTTRSVALTPAGMALLADLAPALGAIERAVAALAEGGSEPSGVLRLTMPRVAAELLIAPRLPQFAERHPGIILDIEVGDGLRDIVAAKFDAGIHLGESLEQDMIAVPIGGPQQMVVVAAPAYLERRGAPAHPREIAGHDAIGRRFTGGEIYRWEFEKGTERLRLDPGAALILNDDRLIVEAARAGAGLAIAFTASIAEDLATGRLVALLEDWCPTFPGFHLYYPSGRQMRPALRAFITAFRGDSGPLPKA